MQFRIREAEDDDAWDLIGLVAGCWSEYPGCVLDVHGEVPELLGIRSHYDRLGGQFWVAEDDRKTVVASIGIAPNGRAGTVALHKLYVAGRARRQGLARQLLEMFEAEARRRGADRVELWSDTRFDDAHRFYERHGFTRAEETRELHDLSNSVEYHFWKELPSG